MQYQGRPNPPLLSQTDSVVLTKTLSGRVYKEKIGCTQRLRLCAALSLCESASFIEHGNRHDLRVSAVSCVSRALPVPVCVHGSPVTPRVCRAILSTLLVCLCSSTLVCVSRHMYVRFHLSPVTTRTACAIRTCQDQRSFLRGSEFTLPKVISQQGQVCCEVTLNKYTAPTTNTSGNSRPSYVGGILCFYSRPVKQRCLMSKLTWENIPMGNWLLVIT